MLQLVSSSASQLVTQSVYGSHGGGRLEEEGGAASAGAEERVDSIPKDKEKEVAADVVVGEYLQLGEGVAGW